MRAKKAKALRKIVFGDDDPRKRIYRRNKSGCIVNMAHVESIDAGTGKINYVPKRMLYRKLKVTTRYIPIKEVRKVFPQTKVV